MTADEREADAATLILTRFIFAAPIVRISHRPKLFQSTTVWGMSVAPALLRVPFCAFRFDRPDWNPKPTPAACLIFAIAYRLQNKIAFTYLALIRLRSPLPLLK